MVPGVQSKSDKCINVMLATTEDAATASTKVKKEEEAKTRAEITPVVSLMERGSQKPSSLTRTGQLLPTPGETLRCRAGHSEKARLLQFLLGWLLDFVCSKRPWRDEVMSSPGPGTTSSLWPLKVTSSPNPVFLLGRECSSASPPSVAP